MTDTHVGTGRWTIETDDDDASMHFLNAGAINPIFLKTPLLFEIPRDNFSYCFHEKSNKMKRLMLRSYFINCKKYMSKINLHRRFAYYYNNK